MNKLDAILHPIRFKIIQRFLDGKKRTAKTLAKEVDDIPQATLYRHLDTLVKTNILQVVEENQIRGTIEKVYALDLSAIQISPEEIQNISKEDHLQYFMFFTAQLTKEFEAYLQRETVDFARDGVGYRQRHFYLSDDELQQFMADLNKVFQKYSNYAPGEKRTLRLFSTVIMPEAERGEKNDEKHGSGN